MNQTIPSLTIASVGLVAAGGAAGSVARYLISHASRVAIDGRFPWGTLCVNIGGCALAGVVLHLAIDRQSLPQNMQLLLLTGFLGGLTTFSAFGFETLRLAQSGAPGLAALNVLANVALSLGAVWIGWLASSVLFA
jgi:CrcB protein